MTTIYVLIAGLWQATAKPPVTPPPPPAARSYGSGTYSSGTYGP